MARRRRILFPGAVYHLMARGNRRARIFEDDADCTRFFALLGDTVARYDVRVYAACLMVNHFHVVGETPRGNLADAMRFLNGVYAQWSNRRHKRAGHLFEARYRSVIVQRELYLKRVSRYVVLNPVRAGLVESPGDWRWTTYRGTAGLETPQPWLSLEWLGWAFRAASRLEGMRRYAEFVNTPARDIRRDEDRVAIGNTSFRAEMNDLARALPLDRELPGPSQAFRRLPLDTILATRTSTRADLRRLMHAAHVLHGYSQGDIARRLDLNRSTVSRAIQRAESEMQGE